MRVKTRSLIKVFSFCLLLLSFASVLYAADDTRFTLKDGVIFDSELGLEWAPAPERPMSHYQAEEYARNLRLANGGWRLPTMEELTSLYDRSKPGGVDARFHVGEDMVWTSELEGSSDARYFVFGSGDNGGGGIAGCDTLLPYIRVLAVRSRR